MKDHIILTWVLLVPIKNYVKSWKTGEAINVLIVIFLATQFSWLSHRFQVSGVQLRMLEVRNRSPMTWRDDIVSYIHIYCHTLQLSYVGMEAQTADGCPTTEAVSFPSLLTTIVMM